MTIIIYLVVNRPAQEFLPFVGRNEVFDDDDFELELFEELLLGVLEVPPVSVVLLGDLGDVLLDSLQLGKQLAQLSGLGFHLRQKFMQC